MKMPNAKEFKNDPARLKKMLKRYGWSNKDAAAQMGIDLGLLGRKLNGQVSHRYDFQYMIECLCSFKPPKK